MTIDQTPDREAWEQRFGKMFETIAMWQKWTEQPPQRPSPGSALSSDDLLFPALPASEVAYAGLLNAVEHLLFFATSLSATGTLWPAANYTILRSALMGSVQALWILTPDDPAVRRERALRAAVDSYNQQRKFVNAASALSTRQAEIVAKNLANLDARLTQAEQVAIKLDLGTTETLKIRKWTLNMTVMLDDVLDVVYPEPSQEVLRSGTRLLWRHESGLAHGTPGSRTFLIRRDDIKQDADGQMWARATSTTSDIGSAATSATLLTSTAWETYQGRCQA